MNQKRYKYPRTPHLPWSPGGTSDDIALDLTACFEGKSVVVTEKLDGENTTLYRDHLHARSIDSAHHPSREWIKRFHGEIGYQIPEGWRICGENLYARHSLAYDDLESYFYAFSIWNEQNYCLRWQETLEWTALLGLVTPPVLYRGDWDEKRIQDLLIDVDRVEGYVVRSADGFHYSEFAKNTAKWVRKEHVQTDEHWMFAAVIPNGLKES